ncbi:hypothetical protein BPOR_0092g00080 [Botrytis porri]|uniref:Uncharacterized protein n=1 Tax=Botrytis porri TaxID=87229 RepID=A0A4Z1KZ35_9HELO|nr:hypothetical protein BPOR_0092g00080 [Botrytis porri]
MFSAAASGRAFSMVMATVMKFMKRMVNMGWRNWCLKRWYWRNVLSISPKPVMFNLAVLWKLNLGPRADFQVQKFMWESLAPQNQTSDTRKTREIFIIDTAAAMRLALLALL